MKHITRISTLRANTDAYSEDEILSILDRIFSFALEVIEAKGKGQLTAE